MALGLTDTRWYDDIADAIRRHACGTSQYLPSEMAAAIDGLVTSGAPVSVVTEFVVPASFSGGTRPDSVVEPTVAETAFRIGGRYRATATAETD